MHNPRQSGLTSLRDALLSAEFTDVLPVDFSHVKIPNPDRLIPPGYYASTTDDEQGPCGHCGAAECAHLEAKRFCPIPPLEFVQRAAA